MYFPFVFYLAPYYEYVASYLSNTASLYAVTTDKKSLIRNDANDWAREHKNPRYILDLLLSVIQVSIETVRIVEGLPKLDF